MRDSPASARSALLMRPLRPLQVIHDWVEPTAGLAISAFARWQPNFALQPAGWVSAVGALQASFGRRAHLRSRRLDTARNDEGGGGPVPTEPARP